MLATEEVATEEREEVEPAIGRVRGLEKEGLAAGVRRVRAGGGAYNRKGARTARGGRACHR